MKGVISTVYLGSVTRKSQRGNEYTVVTFMDDGEPVSAMLAADYNGALPDKLTECEIELNVQLGRYQKCEVLGIDW